MTESQVLAEKGSYSAVMTHGEKTFKKINIEVMMVKYHRDLCMRHNEMSLYTET